MKLAILADIHGNMPALEAVIDDLQRQAPDRVVVAGDLVNRGPENRAVVKAVAAQEWDVIGGNHDELVVAWAEGDVPFEWYDDPWWAPVEWVVEQIDGWISYLEELPFDICIDLPGTEPIRIVHGSPRDRREGLHHFLSDEQIAEILAGVNEQIVVGAHTHIPLERQTDGWHIVNVGAVGLPFNGDTRAQYAVFTVCADGSWDVSFRAVEYDREATLAAFETTGYIEAGLAAWLFKREVETARNHLFPFERWATERDLPLSWETWHIYRKSILSYEDDE